jgi:hypothetical protein
MLAMVLSSPTSDDVVEVTLVVARCRCRVMLVTVLSSHASNGAAEATWPRRGVGVESYWQRCCRVMLATMLPSHDGNGTADATWSWRNVGIESCWRQCCRVMITMVLPRRLGRIVM